MSTDRNDAPENAWPRSPAFVLGIPRSGTTWLANLLDASPDVRLFMEPFSTVSGYRFPELPSTSLFLESSPPELTRFLKGPFWERLHRGKYLFSEKSLTSTRWFRLERMIARLFWTRSGRVPYGWRNRINDFQLLNLNRFDSSYPLYDKSPDTQRVFPVIKELRLAGKIACLQQAFPDSRYVVIMRHPCATVHSILNWFARGRLYELRNELVYWLEAIQSQQVGNQYTEQIAWAQKQSLAAHVALYWRVSYETLYTRLSDSNQSLIIPYEQLASAPRATLQTISEFLGLPWSANFDDYLGRSTGKNDRSGSPTATIRDSARYYRRWVDEIPLNVRDLTLRITESSPLMPLFESFYE